MRYRFAVFLALLFTLPAFAMPGALMDQLSWRFIGPYRGGRVLAVTGVAGQPNVYYFGSVGGGVFKSTDAGLTWQALFQHGPVASIGAIAVAPSKPDVIYLGTGETAIRSDMSYGDGMWRSDDGGEHWSHIGLVDTRHISRILVDADNPEVVTIAAMGHGYGPNPERGIFRSTDGGKHWRKVLFVNDETGAIDLVRDPDHPAHLFATTWNAHRPPWTQYAPVQGSGSALFRSDDDGAHWTRVKTTGLPLTGSGRIGIAVAAHTDGKRLYAVVSADAEHGGIYRSDDGGIHWRLMDGEDRLAGRGWYFGHIYAAPDDPDTVYVPNTALYRSTDGGKTFTAIKGSPDGDDFHTVWFDPTDPQRMMLGVDQGVAISVDGGAHWTAWYNQPTSQIYRLATDHAFPYNIYGTQQDSGSLAIPVRSDEGVITNRSWVTSGGGESGYVLPDPDDTDIVYGSGYGGHVSRLNRRTGQVANIAPWPVMDFGAEPDAAGHYYPWNTALALSPFSGSVLYAGGRVVFRSTDQGDHWQAISPDLTGYSEKTRCHGKPTAKTAAACGYAVIYAIAPSPLQRGLLWVGTTDGKIWRSADGGQHWQQVTPPGLKPWSRIARIEASPRDAGTAYVAIDRHRVDDLKPYIYRTDDGGAHWTEIDSGIAAGAYVHVVRADPKRAGLLFAGTETGVYVSFDDDARWQSLQQDLPTSSVRDLQVHGDDLIAATHGRGFWVLDDIASLRELTSKLADAPAHLFAPAPAYRLRISNYHGEPMPPEIPHAFNPPTGAIIDYMIGAHTPGPVTLSIFDSDGRLVRRFKSTDPQPAEPVVNFRDIWKAPRTPLSAQPGMHRFVWDLRHTPPHTLKPAYSQPAVLHGTPLGPLGFYAMPGQYTVMLSIDGKDYKQPLSVKLDPRVRANHAALQAQADLARAITGAIDRSTAMLSVAKGEPRTSIKAKRLAATLAKFGIKQANSHLSSLLDDTQAADEAPPGSVREAAMRLIKDVDSAWTVYRGLRTTR